MSAHVELIKKKFNCRSWLIRHLKQAGLKEKDLVQIFTTTICPVIEYAAPVYHKMLTGSQVDEIEKLQQRTLKLIFGHRVSYKEALRKTDIPTLETRREEIFVKFARKLSSNPKFDEWFPPHRPYDHDLRTTKIYLEEHR